MAKKKRITPAERRHMDYLRKKGLQVGRIYEGKLIKARRGEVRRLLNLCKDSNPSQWEMIIEAQLREDYLFDWYKGLYVSAGVPRAKSTARDLNKSKAAFEDGIWESELARYAEQQAGEKITLVSGTLKESLVGITRKVLEEADGAGIEKIARQIFSNYQGIELWQARRIAQTETMIGLADAGNIAAQTLDLRFSKQWCTSGLGNTRDTHLAMDGVIVEDWEPFELPDCHMMYPHDSSMGAPGGEIINCACDCIRRPI